MAIDWTTLFEENKGKWIALEDDEETVIGIGETAREALEMAKRRGCELPILMRVPEDNLFGRTHFHLRQDSRAQPVII